MADFTNLLPDALGPALPSTSAGAAIGGMAHDASDVTRKLSAWFPPKLSADAELIPEKPLLDARAADSIRNDSIMAGGVTIWQDSIVGSTYLLNSRPATKILWGKEDDVWETEYQAEVEELFTIWAESPNNWVDVTGILDFTSIIRLGVGVSVVGGEIISLAEWVDDARRPYKTAVRMIDADRLSDPLNNTSPNLQRRLRGGVEVDAFERPTAYWFRNSHPASGQFADYTDLAAAQWTRVDANRPWMRPNLLHVFEQKRPGQNRGLSELTSALTEMRMFKKFNRTQLEKNVVAATYAASIESDLPNDIPAALGAGASSDGSATVDYIASYLEAVNAYSADGKSLHMNGAMIPILPPGTKLNLQNTGAVAPDHDAYVASILRYIASAYNLSYEQLSRDFTKTNYSSARASLGEAWKSLQTKKKMTADRLANFIFRLWLEEAINRNQIEALKRKRVPFFYDGMNADAYSRADWIGAGRGVIDPLKETQADALAIQTRLETREAIIARRSGRDWRAVAKQVKRENDLDTILGLPPVQPVSKQDKADEQNGNAQ